MTPKRKRLWLLVGSLAVLGVAVALVLTALNDNLVFFYSPSQIAEKNIPTERHFRLGGLVEMGSVKKAGQEVRFTVTDTHKTISVVYRGFFLTSSARARASSPRARSGPTASSLPAKSWPSTTRTTCRPRSPRRSRRPGSERAQMMPSIVCAGGRKRLERSEGARARCVEPCRKSCSASLVFSESCGLSPLRFAAAAAARRRPSLTSFAAGTT